MTLTINSQAIELDADQADNLISDLSDLSTDIDSMLKAEDKTQALQTLLTRLNLIVDVYS